MYLQIHPDNPQARNISKVVDYLRNGGVIIYPTDTIYGLGCDIFNTEAINRICRIKKVDPKKSHFSCICSDLSHISDYTKSVDTPTFRLLKNAVPGPFTFILEASKAVPKLFKTKRNTIGIRVPDNKICHEIVKELGHPIVSASLPMDNEVEQYTDPELIYEVFGDLVDVVIDGGPGGIVPSTVLDFTTGEVQVKREGAGDWKKLLGE
ncbi:MAG: threonylcarbamoyl-AMP synthase [Bacteroidetes bacterium]|nr:threonylcarbamoyl-AMP synthase [Bacteroidota bacterium]